MKLFPYVGVLTVALLVTNSHSLPPADQRGTEPEDTQLTGSEPSSSNGTWATQQEDDLISTSRPISDSEPRLNNSSYSDLEEELHVASFQGSSLSIATDENGPELESTSESVAQPLTENTLAIESSHYEFFRNSGEQTSTSLYQSWEITPTETPVNIVVDESIGHHRSRRPKLQLNEKSEELSKDEEPKSKSDIKNLKVDENRSSNTSAQGRSHKHHKHRSRGSHHKHRDNHHHKHDHHHHERHHHKHHEHDYHHRERHHHHRSPQYGHKDHHHRESHDSHHHNTDYADHIHFHDHSHEYPGVCSVYPQPLEKYPSKYVHSAYSHRSGHQGGHDHPSSHHAHQPNNHDKHHRKYHFLDRHGHPDKAHSLYHMHKHYEHYHDDHQGGHDYYGHKSIHGHHERRHHKSNHNDHQSDGYNKGHEHHGRHRDNSHGHHKGQNHHDHHHDCYDCHEHHHHHDRRRRHQDHHNSDDESWSFGNIFRLPMIGHRITLGISGGIKKGHNH